MRRSLLWIRSSLIPVQSLQTPGRSQKYLKHFNVADEYFCTCICLKRGLTWVGIPYLVSLYRVWMNCDWSFIKLILYWDDIVPWYALNHTNAMLGRNWQMQDVYHTAFSHNWPNISAMIRHICMVYMKMYFMTSCSTHVVSDASVYVS